MSYSSTRPMRRWYGSSRSAKASRLRDWPEIGSSTTWPLGKPTLPMKSPGKTTPAPRLQVQALGQFQPKHGERNRNPPAGAQHRIQIAVLGVVVVVDIAGKTQ